jgi:hypothetical protein
MTSRRFKSIRMTCSKTNFTISYTVCQKLTDVFVTEAIVNILQASWRVEFNKYVDNQTLISTCLPLLQWNEKSNNLCAAF